MAALTVAMNSSSCVEILNDTKCVPMWADMVSSASCVYWLADLPHLTVFLAKKGSTSALFISAAFSVSMTARNGGTCSPLFSATCT